MFESFDKKILVGNISYLISKSDLKISEIEKQIDVSPGYISRIIKEDSNKPNLDFIMKFSNVMGVTIDALLYSRLALLVKDEEYLISFLKKISGDTISQKIQWHKENIETICSQFGNINGNIFHPLFKDDELNIMFKILGDVYYTNMKNSLLYVVNLIGNKQSLKNEKKFKQLWLCQNDKKISVIASDEYEWQKKYIDNLFLAVLQYFNHPPLDSDAKIIIDAFMNDDIESDIVPNSSDICDDYDLL